MVILFALILSSSCGGSEDDATLGRSDSDDPVVTDDDDDGDDTESHWPDDDDADDDIDDDADDDIDDDLDDDGTTTTTDIGTTTTASSTTTSTGGPTTTTTDTGPTTTGTEPGTTTTTVTTTTSHPPTTTFPPGVFWTENLADDPLGDLFSPWEIVGSYGSTVSVIAPLADSMSGHLLEVRGLELADHYIYINRPFDPVWEDMWVEFDVSSYASRSDFGFRILQIDGGILYTEAEIRCHGGRLYGVDFWNDDEMDCGGFLAQAGHHVLMRLNFESGAYDVAIDGNSGGCIALSMNYGDRKPFAAFQVIDWPDDDYGGQIWYDNFVGHVPE